jgi:hypothetical protein
VFLPDTSFFLVTYISVVLSGTNFSNSLLQVWCVPLGFDFWRGGVRFCSLLQDPESSEMVGIVALLKTCSKEVPGSNNVSVTGVLTDS